MFRKALKQPVMYFSVLMVALAALFFEMSMLGSLLRQCFPFEVYVFFQLFMLLLA